MQQVNGVLRFNCDQLLRSDTGRKQSWTTRRTEYILGPSSPYLECLDPANEYRSLHFVSLCVRCGVMADPETDGIS